MMDQKIRYVYFGSSEFSAIILEGFCVRSILPVVVITKPDKPQGRGLHVASTAVSRIAERYHIHCLKPQSLKGADFVDTLKGAAADFFIVADYGNIIPASLLPIPRYFSICAHPSLLPRYRGAAPIEYTLLNGDPHSGVSIFKINERVDAGDIILQKKVPIEKADDYHRLRQKLAAESISLLLEAIESVMRGTHALTPQDERQASCTHKLTKEDGRISWGQCARSIHNRMRAMTGWPSAYTYYKGKLIQVLAAEVLDEPVPSQTPGAIVRVDKQGLAVATGEGILKITVLKPQGKKEMSAWAFTCGHHIQAGDRFDDIAEPMQS